MTPEVRDILISLGYNPDECPQEVIALAEAMVAGYDLQPKGEPDAQPDISGDGNPPEKEPVAANGTDENPAPGGGGGEAGGGNPTPGEKNPEEKDVRASADWSKSPRGQRPSAKKELRPAGRHFPGGGPALNECYEIGIMNHLGLSDAAIKASGGYSDAAMNEGLGKRFRNMGIQSFAIEVNHNYGHGYSTPNRDPAFVENFFTAVSTSPPSGVRASGGGFSTIPALSILSNITNHMMRYYYDKFNPVSEKLSEVVPASDLKPFYTYDYDIAGGLVKVAKDGEIANTTLVEEKYQNQVETYARMLMITDEDIMNDNLNAFKKLLQKFARKARVQVERAWFQTFLENAGRFTEEAGTRLRGDLPLTYDNVGAAIAQFGEIEALGSTDEDPEFIDAELKYLLVSPGMEWKAKKLVAGAGIAYGGDEIQGDENLLSKALEVISSPYFGPKMSGGSNLHWAVFPDPSDCPVLQVAYYNGQSAPQCTAFPSQPNYLAQIFRVVHRWGIGPANPRCGVYSDGTGN